MTSVTIDHKEIGRSRVTLQYQSSPKFLAWLDALLNVPQELETVLQKIALQLDIDIAEGVNLDIIGEIVGISRIVDAAIPVQFFGFDGFAGAQMFGEEGNAGIGGRFRDELEPSTATSVLADPDFRLLIKAKIIKNHSKGTNEDVIAGLGYLFGSSDGATPIVVDDNGGMVIQIGIGRPLTFLEKVLISNLDILPRPAGVRISQKLTFNETNYLGFDGQQNAKGFAEEGSLTGGLLAEEF